MANDIQLKRSSVAGRVPDAANVLVGEPVVNLTDRVIYTKDGSGNVVVIGSGNVYAKVSVSSTAPTSPIAGDTWINADTGKEYLYFDDGNTFQWVETGGASYSLGLTTANVTEVTNLYFTNARATAAVTNTTLSNLTIGSGNVFITYQPATTTGAGITLNAANTQGGTGYADFLKTTNISGGATNSNKFFRLTPDGKFEIVNSAYTSSIVALTDGGNLSTTGTITPGTWTAGQVIKDTMLSNSEITVLTTTVATSTSDTDFISYSYTPVSSSSYLIIHVHVASYEAAKTGGSGLDSYFSRIKVDSNEITYGTQYTRDTYTFRTGTLFPLTGRYTNSSTSAKSITVGVRRDSADDNITIVNSATALWMRITEVAR